MIITIIIYFNKLNYVKIYILLNKIMKLSFFNKIENILLYL